MREEGVVQTPCLDALQHAYTNESMDVVSKQEKFIRLKMTFAIIERGAQ